MEAERKSTRAVADSGIEFTEVPPEMTPMLKVVRGDSGIITSLKRASAREPRAIGLGTPKSLQECPPGPRKVISKRRLPSAWLTYVSVPEPSMTSREVMTSRHG